MKVTKLLLVNAAVFVLLFATLDASYSTYRFYLTDTSPDSFWLFEHPGDSVRFDPVMGYFLTGATSRVLRITYGAIETVGFFHGNAQGFADRDDFTRQKSADRQTRIAVFGDSFSAAQSSVAVSWPDRVEDMRGTGAQRPLVLLN